VCGLRGSLDFGIWWDFWSNVSRSRFLYGLLGRTEFIVSSIECVCTLIEYMVYTY